MRAARLMTGVAALAALGGLALPAWAGDGPTGGDDVLVGTPQNDVIEGLGGDDEIYGNRGNDRLGGGAGDDALYGGRGMDILFGRNGADFASGGPRHDEIYGNGGGDELRGGAYADIIVPGNGRDVVHAGPGDDEIFIYNDDKRDKIFCDGGHDFVEIDVHEDADPETIDVFVDCEDVYVDQE